MKREIAARRRQGQKRIAIQGHSAVGPGTSAADGICVIAGGLEGHQDIEGIATPAEKDANQGFVVRHGLRGEIVSQLQIEQSVEHRRGAHRGAIHLAEKGTA